MRVKANEIDVLIVGAGPVGLAMACELRRHGVACRIIDKQARPVQSSRALNVQARTLEVFAQMGIVEQILAAGTQAKGLTIYDRDRILLRMNLQHIKADESLYNFMLILPQSQTERIFGERLSELGGTVERSRELLTLKQEDTAIIAQVKAIDTDTEPVEEIRARWLIGCDGIRSQVRKALNIPFEGTTAPQEFLLADMDLDWSKTRETTHGWLTRAGLFAAFPLPSGQWRLFATATADTNKPEQSFPQASLEVFRHLLIQYTGDTQTTMSNLTWASNFRISYRMASTYRQGHAFLAGDAAHVHSPFGGQGMNIGIQDAYNLAWKLALVLQGKAEENLLNTYQEERWPVAKWVVGGAENATGLLVTQNPAMRWLRDHFFVPLLNMKAIQRYLALQTSELNINYRRSSLSHLPNGNKANAGSSSGWQRAPHAGDRLLPGTILTARDYVKTNLLQALSGTQSHLLLFAGLDPSQATYSQLSKLAASIEAQFNGSITAHLIMAASEQPAALSWSGSILLDPQGRLQTTYGARHAALYFVRPDGYIGFRSQPIHEELLRDYLGQIFSVAQYSSLSV
ncbi:FAD-dependent monooxygenase [Ktedonosporobacter rubrisoli]|nr:FAD-dependent monooxygenase [Ktedonosporobacter rubrisoli]